MKKWDHKLQQWRSPTESEIEAIKNKYKNRMQLKVNDKCPVCKGPLVEEWCEECEWAGIVCEECWLCWFCAHSTDHVDAPRIWPGHLI